MVEVLPTEGVAMRRISRQIKKVTGEVALDRAVRKITNAGATDIKIKKRRPVRTSLRTSRPSKYQISYLPA